MKSNGLPFTTETEYVLRYSSRGVISGVSVVTITKVKALASKYSFTRTDAHGADDVTA